MSCPACGQENPAGFAFCGRCGAVLTAGSARALLGLAEVLAATDKPGAQGAAREAAELYARR